LVEGCEGSVELGVNTAPWDSGCKGRRGLLKL
jgi:hypothetical protein